MAHGGKVFWASELTGIPPEGILDFSSNTNAFFDPELLRRLLSERLPWIAYYPEPSRALRSLSSFLGIGEEYLWIGNGSADLLYLLLMALFPRRVLIPVPTFSEYERASRAVGAEVSFLPLSEEGGFRINPDEVIRAARDADLVFLCNPNNPTGVLLGEDEVRGILEGLRGWLLVDEAFVDFVDPGRRPNLVPLLEEGRLCLLRSLTKALSVPGLRIGYLMAPPDLVRKVKALSSPWPINTLAQAVLEDLVALWRAFETGLPSFFEERRRFASALAELMGVFPSQGNFLLLKAPLEDLPSRLLPRGILVRGPEGFRNLSPWFIRVAIRKAKENQRLIEALKEVMSCG